MKRAILVFFIFHFSLFILKAQRYYLYGEASAGGKYGDGVLFRFDPFTGKDSMLFNFNGTNGNSPYGSLSLMPNQILYGSCAYGGSQNEGILFNYNLLTGNENTIIDFIGSNGDIPSSNRVIYNGILYGTTGSGGKYGAGVIFSYNPISNIDSVVFNFNDTDGATIYGGLFVLSDTSFYGMTGEGGNYHDGVIYRFNPVTNKETVLFNFNGSIDGAYSDVSFIKDSNGLLYAVTAHLGTGGGGTLLSFNPSTGIETTLVSFNGTNGKNSAGDLLLATDGLLYGLANQGGSKNDGVLFSYNASRNSYNVIVNFDSTNGKYPNWCNIIEDTVNKILYGVTMNGGKYNKGVIFSYNLKTGKDSVLLNFDGANGANPYGTLLLVPYTSEDGINEIKNNGGDVKIYPNPAANFINIESSISGENYFYLYDNMGRLVQSAELKSNLSTISLVQLPDGIYYYRVVSKEQEIIRVDKLLIIR